MKGDFSRHTFDPRRHFTTVRMQQGRVQLDADWNEQTDMRLYRDEIEAVDVIGGCGGPLDAAAFGVVLDLNDLDPAEKALLAALDPKYEAIVPGDFVLTPGRYYVDGVLCESEHAVPYTRQPDLPGLATIDVSKKGFTIVYLDVWQRHLTYLDDPLLREAALGGPDTATRTKTVWQVRTVFAGAEPTTCADEPPAYLDAIADGTGLLGARAKHEETTPDPCLVPASAGYRGLENQLYRVEIHSSGEAYDLTAAPGDVSITIAAPDQVVHAGPSGPWAVGKAVEVFRSAAGSDPLDGFLATIVANDTATKTLTLNTALPDLGVADLPRVRSVGATFKWSRDNGSVATLVSSVAGKELTVASVGPDEALGFAAGQWVELIDEVTELAGRPGFLAKIEDVDPAARIVTLRASPPAFGGKVLKLRRWDGVGAVKANPPGASEPFIELENGVQVSFSEGTYDTGDYWLIPARTATADQRSGKIEWPTEADEPLAQPPLGIRHHYCRLAILESDGTTFEVEDCRSLFPPLTELTSFFYVGGDGQDVMPDPSAPNAATPVELPQPLEVGVANGSHPVEGATVRFTIFNPAPAGTVNGKADFDEVLTGSDGLASCKWAIASNEQKQQVRATLLVDGAPSHLPIDFSAQRSRADEVRYFPPGGCKTLAPAHDVQSAIDRLGELVHVSCVSGDGQEVAPPDRGNLEPLQVRVWSACGPIKGAKVDFKLLEGGESITPTQATTDDAGLASSKWVLNGNNERQRAIATLVELGPNAGPAAAIHEPTSSVEFIARLDLGAVGPSEPVIKIRRVQRGDGEDLVNADEFAAQQLLKGEADSTAPGIVITTDRPIDPETVAGKATANGVERTNSHPTCYVTIELPWPSTPHEVEFWGGGDVPIGFEKIVLAAEVMAKGTKIFWTPDEFARRWLLSLLDQALEGRADRILARLTLKGAFIRDDERLFLDGEPFGPKSTVNDNASSGDDQPGGDFEIWFWLVRG
jgi:hypothetical protein